MGLKNPYQDDNQAQQQFAAKQPTKPSNVGAAGSEFEATRPTQSQGPKSGLGRDFSATGSIASSMGGKLAGADTPNKQAFGPAAGSAFQGGMQGIASGRQAATNPKTGQRFNGMSDQELALTPRYLMNNPGDIDKTYEYMERYHPGYQYYTGPYYDQWESMPNFVGYNYLDQPLVRTNVDDPDAEPIYEIADEWRKWKVANAYGGKGEIDQYGRYIPPNGEEGPDGSIQYLLNGEVVDPNDIDAYNLARMFHQQGLYDKYGGSFARFQDEGSYDEWLAWVLAEENNPHYRYLLDRFEGADDAAKFDAAWKYMRGLNLYDYNNWSDEDRLAYTGTVAQVINDRANRMLGRNVTGDTAYNPYGQIMPYLEIPDEDAAFVQSVIDKAYDSESGKLDLSKLNMNDYSPREQAMAQIAASLATSGDQGLYTNNMNGQPLRINFNELDQSEYNDDVLYSLALMQALPPEAYASMDTMGIAELNDLFDGYGSDFGRFDAMPSDFEYGEVPDWKEPRIIYADELMDDGTAIGRLLSTLHQTYPYAYYHDEDRS